MIRLRNFWVAILAGGAVFSHSAAAQHGDGSKSLTHVVSVTIGPRVKVKVSPLSMLASRSVPGAVKVTAVQASSNGLALTVHANQSWVLSIKSAAAADGPRGSTLHWSGSQAGRFSTVFFRDAAKAGTSTTRDHAVVLTVSAP